MSLVLEGKGFMKKRHYSVSISQVVFPISQGLSLQVVSLPNAVYILLFCLSCSVLQTSCLQGLSLPAVGSVWSLA